jgi:serine/threonine protein kinase
MDALVAERLTSSPRIYDIYGYCGLGILSEFFPHGDMEDVAVPGEGYIKSEKLQDGSELQPQNDLTALQKLEICTQMAEALADLHGNPNGVIVHQDMQLSQFLWTADKSRVKLNDFNRAEYMLWDDEEKEYCRYHEGLGNGNVCILISVRVNPPKNFLLTFFLTWCTSGVPQKNITISLSMSKSMSFRWGTTSTQFSQDCGHSTTRMMSKR